MDLLAAISRESALFWATAAEADPSLPVPSCPAWDVGDLVWHLGEVHWFWGSVVEQRASDPDSVEATKPPRPAAYPALVDWGRAQTARLVALLGDCDDATRVWTWSPPHQNIGFIRRHQVQEAAVHRWDLQEAVRPPADPLACADALDALDEFLAVTVPWAVNAERPLPGSVHLHCTDGAGEWTIGRDGDVTAGHARSDVALRGGASDLLLVLFKRIDLARVEVIGDGAVAAELLKRLNTG